MLNMKVESNIYTLLNISKSDRIVLDNIKEQLSNEVIFVSDDIETLKQLKILNDKYNIFIKLQDTITNDIDIKTSLEGLKLVGLNKEAYNEIINNPDTFMLNAINNIFNNFEFRILPLQNDMLNLSSKSSLLQTDINIDISNARLYSIYDNVKYYIARGELKEGFSGSDLLAFIASAKEYASKHNASLLSSGGAIFAAIGEHEGNIESIYMSAISLVLIAMLLLSAFGSMQIFSLIFIVGFSFLCGLAGGLLVLKELHLLSIVISTSLIGLILDFSMHYLSLNYKHSMHISKLKRLFLIGLAITCSGYGIFLLSPMIFLHQIAIISIFTLIGAIVATYFLLPKMIKHNIKPSKRFRFYLICYILWLKRLRAKHLYIFILLTLLAMPLLLKLDFNENIKNYYSPPKELLDETSKIAKITHNDTSMQFLVFSKNDGEDLIQKERSLLTTLESRGLVSGYDALSSRFLSLKEQQELKERLLDSIKKHSIFLATLGFNKDEINNFIKQIKDLKVLDITKHLPHGFGLERFLLDEKSSVVFLKNPNINGEFLRLLDSANVKLIDFNSSINKGFSDIKHNAIWLKILAYAIAWIALCIFFGLKRGSIMAFLVLLSTMLSLIILALLNVNINIFSIFGLILASVVGVDYMIFALHKSSIQATLGILLASLTSIISFLILSTSSTYALFAFGISTSLCMSFCAFFATILAIKKS